jgi:hypothetical protein
LSEAKGTAARSQGPGASNEPFSFVESPGEVRDEAAIVVRIPAGIRSKQKLLSVLADKLQFPGYFGWNWDAFEELLQDLSWLPEGRPVLIVHEDLPFGKGGEHRGTYLGILAGLAHHAGGRRVRVIFPVSTAAEVGPEPREPRQPT